jgi:uncharacterized membrane protein
MQKTVIGSFDSYDEAQRVVEDLKREGFMASDISVVASNVRGTYGTDATEATTPDDTSGAATGAVTGGVIGGAAGLAASLMGLAIPGIGPIIAAGPIVAALTGAGVGAVAGGLIGGLTDLGVSEEDAKYYAESVRRGGALVTLRADETRAERAADIMRDHGAVDIERRVETWRQTGWSGFDPNAQPYSADDLDREHAMYGTREGGSTRTTATGGRGVSDRSLAGAGTMGSTGIGGAAGTGGGYSTGSQMGTTSNNLGAGSMSSTYSGSATPRTSAEWDAYEREFRSDYEQNYAGRGGRYEDFQPAYRHGWESAGRYRGRQWNDVESDIQRDWETRNPNQPWQQFKNAARRGWDRMSDAVERATPGDSDRDGK